jgi:ribonuclease VapC
MFLDASVIVACLAGEPEESAIYDVIENASALITSPISVFEVSSRVAVLWSVPIAGAHAIVMEWLGRFAVTIIAIGEAEMRAAHLCASVYHRTTGHPARLNMGDCFAYACARTQGVQLVYKGNDFVHTDVVGIGFGG